MSTHTCGVNVPQLGELEPPTTKILPSVMAVAVPLKKRGRGGLTEGIVVSVQSLFDVLKYSAVLRPVHKSDVPPMT
jgi:hypothetical protein